MCQTNPISGIPDSDVTSFPTEGCGGKAALRARWVVPVIGPPIENGRVEIRDGLIASVGPVRTPGRDELDLGDVVLIPGLINAHTHLELTRFRGRVPFTGSFTDWIERLTRLTSVPRAKADLARPDVQGNLEQKAPYEQGGANETDTTPDQRDAQRGSIRDGLSQSVAAGVTTIVDIGYGHHAVEEWSHAPCSVVGLLETLGMGPKRDADHPLSIRRMLRLCLDNGVSQPRKEGECEGLIHLGLAPHAPYSTDPSIYRKAVDCARRSGRLVATHLAETRDEIRFLADATGPFRDLLETRGLWDGSFTVPRCSPVRYAQQLGLLEGGSLLIHVNYLSESDLDLLAEGKASVVFCPRTHAFFDHEPHRYRDMLDRSINVCLGTDSLASNDTLSILDELRILRVVDEDLPGDLLLELATIRAARALGCEGRMGAIRTGYRADFVAVPLGDLSTNQPVEDILRSNTSPRNVVVAGRSI